MSLSELAAQALQGTQAWTTLTAVLDQWTPPASASASSPSPSPLPSAAAVRAAFVCLRSLHLDALFIDHVIGQIVQPWLEQQLLRKWWATLDEFVDLQLSLFDAPRAPRRFHPKLNEWLLRGVEQAVREAQQGIKPLVERLTMLDDLLLSSGLPPSSAAPLLLLPRFRRSLRTAFESSLSRACDVRPRASEEIEDGAPAPPVIVRRSEVFQELLFKFYRLNFRAFHRCALAREEQEERERGEENEESAALRRQLSVDETMEAQEAEAEVQAEEASESVNVSASEMQDVAASASTSSPLPVKPRTILMKDSETTLQRFVWICRAMRDMQFIGSTPDEQPSFPSAASSSSSSSSVAAASSSLSLSLSLPPISSWITPEYFLDFFFILIEKYLRHTCLGEWEEEKLHQVNEWMRRRVRPFLHVILLGEVQQKDSSSSPLPSSLASSSRYTSFLHWSSRLHFYCMECLGLMRIREELFDIIKDYPDSLPALNNLAELLSITKQQKMCIDNLSQVLRTRLLQPGTNTRSILQQYANLIHCARVLDPQGNHSLLGGILAQSRIGSYVKARPDAVRCVVRAIWGGMDERKAREREEEEADNEEEEEENENMEEKKESDLLNASSTGAAAGSKSAAPAVEESEPIGLDLLAELESTPDATQFGDDSDAEDNNGVGGEAAIDGAAGGHSGDGWHPDPLSGESASNPSAASSRYLRKADVLSLLIDLCGNGDRNEELLLLDYKNFLSSRLLSKRSRPTRPAPGASSSSASASVTTQDAKDPLFDTEVEVTHLELMKLRFGDVNTSLLDVEVMLKDVVQTKRIQAQIMAPAKQAAAAALAQEQKKKLSMLQQTIVERAGKRKSEEEEDEEEAALIPPIELQRKKEEDSKQLLVTV